MANIIIDGSEDMSTFDISTVSDGTITTNNSTVVSITATDGVVYKLEGDFSGGSGTTLPTEGTITRIVITNPETEARTVVSGLTYSVTQFEQFLNNGASEAFLKSLFANDDTFNLTNGTTDNVIGGAGDDHFVMGGALVAGDSIQGNGGSNTVTLNGTYEALTLTDTTLQNIGKLTMQGDTSYNITTADGTVAAHHSLVVDARPISQLGSLTFNGSAETDGSFQFFLGGMGNTNVTGGAGNDSFHGAGTNATLNGGGGNDTFYFGGAFDGTDTIDGGTGTNLIRLDGDYSAGLTFGATSLQNISDIILVHGTGNSYDLTLNAENDTGGQNLKIDGSSLHSTDTLTFDGSAVQGNLNLVGGNGADTLTGGHGHTTFDGGLGADTLDAGDKSNHFIYAGVTDSNGARHDTINGFDAVRDDIDVLNGVNSVDTAVTTGSLSTATFVTDLKADLGASALHVHDAVLFTASSGDLAGDTFLVIDQNGVAGYQSDGDLVIQITNGTNLSSLSASDFHAQTVFV
jgi:Ca2+-binding RTX toxin-like protein